MIVLRDILFRAKGIDKKRWFYGHYYCEHDTTHCCMECTPDETHHFIIFEEMTDWELPNKRYRADIDVSTLGQYLGITDSKGCKIYEGDIIQKIWYQFSDELTEDGPFFKGYYKTICVIKYDEIAFIFEEIYQEKLPLGYIPPIRNGKDYIQVIGNIHDNPEVLNNGGVL